MLSFCNYLFVKFSLAQINNLSTKKCPLHNVNAFFGAKIQSRYEGVVLYDPCVFYAWYVGCSFV